MIMRYVLVVIIMILVSSCGSFTTDTFIVRNAKSKKRGAYKYLLQPITGIDAITVFSQQNYQVGDTITFYKPDAKR